MTIFEKAVQLSLETWVDSLPESNDIPTYEFSKRHNKKMKRLINIMRGDRYHLLTSTEEKIVYELNKGIVGIYIHKLKDKDGNQTDKGANPFYSIYTNGNERLSKYVTCFDSLYLNSKNVYDDISNNIEQLIEDAISCKAPR